jgi:hypothetical protein
VLDWLEFIELMLKMEDGRMEMLRGYHSSSSWCGGVIYNITCTILLHLSTHPTKNAPDVRQCR